MINLYRLLMLGAFVFLPMLAPTTITTAMTGNSATRRRYRKVSSEKDKPLWVMVFILLISANIALWLGLMETRNRIVWTKMVEVRIAKVESLLNKSVKMREIEEHASDYALASGGGMVVKHSHPYFTDRKLNNWFLMKTNGGVHPDADKMLIPSFGGEPGHCFPLKGSTGFVQIKLSRPVIPQAITLEHLPKGVAYDRSNAPKDCRVTGWLQGNDMGSAVDLQKMFLLTEFKYDLEKSNAQSFKVLDLATSAVVDTIRLEFSSNHGSLSHTCIYWLRVHGYEPNSV